MFEDLSIFEETKKAIEEIGITTATPIQALTIPYMLEGFDFIGQAQTGTGKTFAFAIPIIEKINVEVKKIQSLILCPTRELALQVYNQFIKLVKYNEKIKISVIVGGESYDRQFKSLKRKPQIIIGTPGRIIDHMNRNTIDFSALSILTLDEADEMLKMGFQDEITQILENTPNDRQTVLFSATIPNEIKKIAKKYQKDSKIIKDEEKSLAVEAISQNYYVVQKSDKMALLKRILDYNSVNSAIIFANRKVDVEEITEELLKFGYDANMLHGDLKQSQRSIVTNSFRNKNLTILVATDVAARGLDISNVELVINYELPHELEVYVHRIGRTGRAGAKGIAYSLVTLKEKAKILELEKFSKSKINFLNIPSNHKIMEKKLDKFIDDLSASSLDENLNYNEIIKAFNERGINNEELLKKLLFKIMPSVNLHDDIKIIDVDLKKDNKGYKNFSKNSNNYKLYKISLGRKDKINPNNLLELLSNYFDIRPKNIGDIKHFDKHTNFEVNNKVISILKDSRKIKFKGKNAVIQAI